MHYLLSPTTFAPPQAFRRRPGKGCRLSDRAQASFAFRPWSVSRHVPTQNHKAGKHYEAREGVPAGLARFATERASHQAPQKRIPAMAGILHRYTQNKTATYLFLICLLSPMRMVIFSLSRYSSTGMANLRVSSVRSRKSWGPISWLDSKKPRTRPMISSMAVLA